MRALFDMTLMDLLKVIFTPLSTLSPPRCVGQLDFLQDHRNYLPLKQTYHFKSEMLKYPEINPEEKDYERY
jgi:hypothetical protein